MATDNYKTCIRCRSPASLICQRCRENYCSPECQNMHWPVHKLQCSITFDNVSSSSFRSRQMANRKTDHQPGQSKLNASIKGPLQKRVQDRNMSSQKDVRNESYQKNARKSTDQKPVPKADSAKSSVQSRLQVQECRPTTDSNVEQEKTIESTPAIKIPIAYQVNRVQNLQLLLKAHLAAKHVSRSE